MQDPRTLPELVDQVATHLYDSADGSTLRAMSLVCRLWMGISRPYVFRKVVLTSQRCLERLVVTLQANRDTLHHVRVLVVHPAPEDFLAPATWVSDVPRTLAPLLPALRSVELVQVHQERGQLAAPFLAALAGFATVESLAVRNCFADAPFLHGVLAALPALRRVRLVSWLAIGGDPRDGGPFARSPRLEALEIRLTSTYLDSTSGILPWLMTTETAQSLRTLRVTVRSYDSTRVGRFIQAVGAQLEHLELELQVFLGLPHEKETMKGNVSIAHCERLRTFAIVDLDMLSAAAVGFIDELRSHDLERITLTFACDARSPEALPNMACLDASLDRASPRRVKAVEIRYHGPLETAAARAVIQAALPTVHSRGILVVVRA